MLVPINNTLCCYFGRLDMILKTRELRFVYFVHFLLLLLFFVAKLH